MRRILVLLSVVGLLVGITATGAIAAPSDVRITVDGQAQFVSPTTMLLPVTYTCPATFVTAFISANVSQAETGATGSGGIGAPCTGQSRTVVVPITSFGMATFTLGQARAQGFVSTGFQSDTNIRRIQIVL